MEYKDYYKTLGLKRDATLDEIKSAYRKLARKHHPDVSKETDAALQFSAISEAHEVLKDPKKRAAYDEIDPHARSERPYQNGSQWGSQADQFSRAHRGNTAGGDQYSDFFAEMFGRQSAGASGWGSENARGQDMHAKMDLDLEDVFKQTSHSINLQSQEVDAQGQIRPITRSINVKIPQGMKDGQQIRLTGQGLPGSGTGAKGDLYIEIHFRAHPLFQIDGVDLHMQLPITPWEAALGAKIKVPTPGGNVDLKIAPGSNSGNKLRLKGRGIPGSPAGDIYLTLIVMAPAAETDAAKALYQEMEKTLAFNPRQSMGV